MKAKLDDPLLAIDDNFITTSYIIYDGKNNNRVIIVANNHDYTLYPNIIHRIPNIILDEEIRDVIKKYDIMMPRWLTLYMIAKEQSPKDIMQYLIINHYINQED